MVSGDNMPVAVVGRVAEASWLSILVTGPVIDGNGGTWGGSSGNGRAMRAGERGTQVLLDCTSTEYIYADWRGFSGGE